MLHFGPWLEFQIGHEKATRCPPELERGSSITLTGFYYMRYITRRTYGFSPHPEVTAIMVIVACSRTQVQRLELIPTLCWSETAGLQSSALDHTRHDSRHTGDILPRLLSPAGLPLSRCAVSFAVSRQQRHKRALISREQYSIEETWMITPPLRLDYHCDKPLTNCPQV